VFKARTHSVTVTGQNGSVRDGDLLISAGLITNAIEKTTMFVDINGAMRPGGSY